MEDEKKDVKLDTSNDATDKNVKKAIDDIFGDDFIDINVNQMSSDVIPKNNYADDQEDETNLSDEKENIEVKEEITNLNQEQKEEINNEMDFTKTIKEPVIDNEEKTSKEADSRNFNKKKILIYFIIGFAVGLVFIYFIISNFINKKSVINCSYSAKDVGYQTTDEYKITYQNDKIIYIEGTYNYVAKNDEFKQQIEYIKKDKLPVIINSNGLPGFTYTYENGDDFFKVSSYLDFSLFDFDMIDKNNSEVTPISYIKINSKTTYSSLKKDLEKQGYVCTLSK